MRNQYGEFTRWTENEDNLITMNYAKTPIEHLCNLLPKRTKSAIRTRAKKLGASLRAGEKQRIYSVNENYFASPTIDNCYWAGYIAADGCLLHQGNRRMLTFCIKNLMKTIYSNLNIV
jgi:hypothetical protein